MMTHHGQEGVEVWCERGGHVGDMWVTHHGQEGVEVWSECGGHVGDS